MGNYAGHSHVTGSGYNSIGRKCVKCGHPELVHWEDHCAFKERKCSCRGFAARRLTREEQRVIREQRREAAVARKVGIDKRASGAAARVEEQWLKDIREEWLNRRVEGIDS